MNIGHCASLRNVFPSASLSLPEDRRVLNAASICWRTADVAFSSPR